MNLYEFLNHLKQSNINWIDSNRIVCFHARIWHTNANTRDACHLRIHSRTQIPIAESRCVSAQREQKWKKWQNWKYFVAQATLRGELFSVFFRTFSRWVHSIREFQLKSKADNGANLNITSWLTLCTTKERTNKVERIVPHTYVSQLVIFRLAPLSGLNSVKHCTFMNVWPWKYVWPLIPIKFIVSKSTWSVESAIPSTNCYHLNIEHCLLATFKFSTLF